MFANKKILKTAAGMAVLTVGIYYLNRWHVRNMERRYKETYDTLKIELADTDTVEYGDPFDMEAMVLHHTGELTEEGTVDTMKPGEYHLVFTVTAKDPEYLQTVEKTAKRTIMVQDTQLPEITLSEETVLIKEGSEYHPEENVAKVNDPVDGELEYTVETELDPAVPGEYEVTVTAADHNGNTAEKVFAVTVKSRPQFTGNAGIIFDYLTNEMGLNDAAACGVMANIRYESTFDPEAESYYYGLCQWGGGRRDLLVSWCSENGYEYNTVEGQLAFLNYELNESYPAALNGLLEAEDSAEGANEAAVIFCRIYEGAASLGGRPSLAEDYYNS